MITNKLEYYIDSKLRESNSVSEDDFYFKIDIPNEIKNKITHVSITYITIPKSSYVIEDNNNRNKFRVWKESVGYLDITLREGNYSNTNTYGSTYDIKKEVKTQLDTQTGDIWTLSKYLHPDVDTGKILFECNDATNKKFDFGTYKNNINEVLGFANISSETDVFTTSIVSTSICNINKNNVCYLVSDICIHENKDKALNGQSVLDVIYLSENKLFSFVSSQHDLIENMKPFNNKGSTQYYFKLYNENGREMILNNISISFTLCLFTYLPNELLYKKLSNYIDYKLISQ